MNLKELSKEIQDDLKEGIANIVIWKLGNSWMYKAFWDEQEQSDFVNSLSSKNISINGHYSNIYSKNRESIEGYILHHMDKNEVIRVKLNEEWTIKTYTARMELNRFKNMIKIAEIDAARSGGYKEIEIDVIISDKLKRLAFFQPVIGGRIPIQYLKLSEVKNA